MMRYSIESSDRIFVRGYCYLSFAKNTTKNFGKKINKTLILDHPKQSATGALKTT